jgi:hypothetical protein
MKKPMKAILLILALAITIPSTTYAIGWNGWGGLHLSFKIARIGRNYCSPYYYYPYPCYNLHHLYWGIPYWLSNWWWGGYWGYWGYPQPYWWWVYRPYWRILIIIDPPPATIHSGDFTIHYPSDLMEPVKSASGESEFGWLGSWGTDLDLLAPPTDPSQWQQGDDNDNGMEVVLQGHNLGLTAETVETNGIQTTTFNWGTSGYSSTESFNMFASAFEFKENVKVTYLGDFAEAPEDANLYVSTNGINCTSSDGTSQSCGESTTSYYKVELVPEPPKLATLIDDSFTANASSGVVNLAWESASEIDNAGFFVWRGQLPAGKTECSANVDDYTEVKKISPFILAQGSGSPYSYEDNQAVFGNNYCYALEDVDLNGKSTYHLDNIITNSMP